MCKILSGRIFRFATRKRLSWINLVKTEITWQSIDCRRRRKSPLTPFTSLHFQVKTAVCVAVSAAAPLANCVTSDYVSIVNSTCVVWTQSNSFSIGCRFMYRDLHPRQSSRVSWRNEIIIHGFIRSLHGLSHHTILSHFNIYCSV